MLIHTPDSSVEWASQLPPAYVDEVSQAVRVENPAARSWSYPAESTACTPGEICGSCNATRP